jgi:hypothetical protein
LKFEGKPKFAGIGLAKRTMEVRVLRDGEKLRRFSGTSTGEAGREKLAAMPGPEDTAGMEACGFAFSPARYQKRQTGCAAHVLNPGKRAMIWKPARKRIPATRREYYADISREGLVKRQRRYKAAYEGQGLDGQSQGKLI